MVLLISIELLILLISLISFHNRKLFSWLIFHPNKKLQLHRYFTYAFVHANYIHVIVNCFIFFIFSYQVQIILGNILFLEFIFGSILFSILPYIFKDYIIVGLSGCTSALIYFCILQHPVFFWVSIPYLLYCWYRDQYHDDNIAHASHLWGSVFAFLFTLILFPYIVFNIFVP